MLDRFEGQWRQLREQLESDDAEGLLTLLEEAKQTRDQWIGDSA